MLYYCKENGYMLFLCLDGGKLFHKYVRKDSWLMDVYVW